MQSIPGVNPLPTFFIYCQAGFQAGGLKGIHATGLYAEMTSRQLLEDLHLPFPDLLAAHSDISEQLSGIVYAQKYMSSTNSQRFRHKTAPSPQEPALKQSLASDAYNLIRSRILKGMLPFGAVISRRELSKELGISLLPIATALQRLEHESLIETVSRVGTRVRTPTPQEIRGFYVVREALEAQAARLFAQRAGKAEQKHIKQLAVHLDQLYAGCADLKNISEDQLYDLREHHMHFHRQIAEYSGCPYLIQAIENNHILIFNWFYDRLFGRPGLPKNWHLQLIKHLSKGDPEEADKAMRKHVQFRMDEVIEKLEPYYTLNGLDLDFKSFSRKADR